MALRGYTNLKHNAVLYNQDGTEFHGKSIPVSFFSNMCIQSVCFLSSLNIVHVKVDNYIKSGFKTLFSILECIHISLGHRVYTNVKNTHFKTI